MMRMSLTLSIMAFGAMALGWFAIAGITFEVGRELLFLFHGLSVGGFLLALTLGRREVRAIGGA